MTQFNSQLIALPNGDLVNANQFNAVVALHKDGFGSDGVLVATANNCVPPIITQNSTDGAITTRDDLLGRLDTALGAPVARTVHGDYVKMDTLVKIGAPRRWPPHDCPAPKQPEPPAMVYGTNNRGPFSPPPMPEPQVSYELTASWASGGRGDYFYDGGPGTLRLSTDTEEQALWARDRLAAPSAVAADRVAAAMG